MPVEDTTVEWPEQLSPPVTVAKLRLPQQDISVGADWEAPIIGLLNIKHPKAVAAGITDHKEPIKIYAHVVRHPTHGFFLVDTGVSRRLVEDPVGLGVGMMLRKYGGIEKMHPQQSTAEIIEVEGVPLNGVFMTHLHLDHVSGLPDVPKDVPIYTGANEAEASLFLNLFAQGTNNHLLAGRPPLEESSSRRMRAEGSKVSTTCSATARSSRS
jgi:hypothetical protein